MRYVEVFFGTILAMVLFLFALVFMAKAFVLIVGLMF